MRSIVSFEFLFVFVDFTATLTDTIRFPQLLQPMLAVNPHCWLANRDPLPAFEHVGADLRVRPSEEGAHTGAPLRHDPAAIAVMPGSDTPPLAAG